MNQKYFGTFYTSIPYSLYQKQSKIKSNTKNHKKIISHLVIKWVKVYLTPSLSPRDEQKRLITTLRLINWEWIRKQLQIKTQSFNLINMHLNHSFESCTMTRRRTSFTPWSSCPLRKYKKANPTNSFLSYTLFVANISVVWGLIKDIKTVLTYKFEQIRDSYEILLK